MRWTVYAVSSLVIGNTVASSIVYLLQCEHVNYWDDIFHQNCRINPESAILAFGAIYIATDVAIWLLPLPMVIQLQLQPREKVFLMSTFGLGATACIASGFRLQAVVKYTNYSAQSSSTLLIHIWSM
ncbi:hypothetical protein ABW20_dc0101997 [Dactylellina cionopaga]|nr:hypothetical protein ABW20_dc0101997 [Dactylellina cionopaga]